MSRESEMGVRRVAEIADLRTRVVERVSEKMERRKESVLVRSNLVEVIHPRGVSQS